jgi:hypothetical protein
MSALVAVLPSPASLNLHCRNPLVPLMLKSHDRKCGLSAVADEAPIAAARAVTATNASMRRIADPLLWIAGATVVLGPWALKEAAA